jgi:hypothetical protein
LSFAGGSGQRAPPLPKLTQTEARSRLNARIRAELAAINQPANSAARTTIQNAAAASRAVSIGAGKTLDFENRAGGWILTRIELPNTGANLSKANLFRKLLGYRSAA